MVEDFVIQAVIVPAEQAVRQQRWEMLARDSEAAAALAYETPVFKKDLDKAA